MNYRSLAALALVAAFSLPIAASAASTATPAPKHMKKDAAQSKNPGAPGYSGSSKLGSAEKASKKAAKKAAKKSSM